MRDRGPVMKRVPLCVVRTIAEAAAEIERLRGQLSEKTGEIDGEIICRVATLHGQLAACQALLREAVVNNLWIPVLHRDSTLSEKTLTFHRAQWLRAARAAGEGGGE